MVTPSTSKKNRKKQLSAVQANRSRLLTAFVRPTTERGWCKLKQWKMFSQRLNNFHITRIYKLTCIMAAVLNEFSNPIVNMDASLLAVEKYNTIMKHINTKDNTLSLNMNKDDDIKWTTICKNENEMNFVFRSSDFDFPRFNLQDLIKLFNNSSHLLQLSKQYAIHSLCDIKIMVPKRNKYKIKYPKLFKIVTVRSRFKSRKTYQMYIDYSTCNNDDLDNLQYCCSCPIGNRTCQPCVHIGGLLRLIWCHIHSISILSLSGKYFEIKNNSVQDCQIYKNYHFSNNKNCICQLLSFDTINEWNQMKKNLEKQKMNLNNMKKKREKSQIIKNKIESHQIEINKLENHIKKINLEKCTLCKNIYHLSCLNVTLDDVKNDYEIGWRCNRCNNDEYGDIIYDFPSLTENDAQYELMFNDDIKYNNKCDEECMLDFLSLKQFDDHNQSILQNNRSHSDQLMDVIVPENKSIINLKRFRNSNNSNTNSNNNNDINDDEHKPPFKRRRVIV